MATSKYPSMKWNAPDIADTFKLYKQRLLLVCEDNDVTENERIASKKFKSGVITYAASTHPVCQKLNGKIPQSCGRCLRRSRKLP